MTAVPRVLPLLLTVLLLALLTMTAARAQAPANTLDLSGYQDQDGAISVLHGGASVDPYFALQALLLARDNGLDISQAATRWAHWLAPRQKPDATFDRFCRHGPVWAACQRADADDSLLALWLQLLDTMPRATQANARWRDSHRSAAVALRRLLDPGRGVYLVSQVYPHGLLMDNLEVWSYHSAAGTPAGGQAAQALAGAIQRTFWDRPTQRFLVSTQPEQKHETPKFYPDAVAQVFPLLVGFPWLPMPQPRYYQRWMQAHRAEWLDQVRHDYAWGLIAVLAWQQRDAASARCWLRATRDYRHSGHWTVTDDVALQILAHHGLQPAEDQADCR